VKLALVVLLAVIAGCKEKPKAKEPAPAPARTTQVAPAQQVPLQRQVPQPQQPQQPQPVIDAGDPIDAPPTRSEVALATRAEFFTKVNKTSKRGAGDCRALLAELERFAAEARGMAQRRAEITGAEVAQDDAIVATTLRSLTRITSACPEKDRFDAFLNILGDVPR
jgi:hypothetical protein